MAVSLHTVKIPFEARVPAGRVRRGSELYVYLTGTTTEATVYPASTGVPGEELEQPLISDQYGRFIGWVVAGRYDVVIDGGAAEPWDAVGAGLAWHQVGGAGEPAFQNSWANYSFGYANAAFAKDAYDMVRLRGSVQGGTVSTAIFTLPAGFRPSAPAANANWYPIVQSPSISWAQIGNDGVVKAPAFNSQVSLDGITFKAEA